MAQAQSVLSVLTEAQYSALNTRERVGAWLYRNYIEENIDAAYEELEDPFPAIDEAGKREALGCAAAAGFSSLFSREAFNRVFLAPMAAPQESAINPVVAPSDNSGVLLSPELLSTDSAISPVACGQTPALVASNASGSDVINDDEATPDDQPTWGELLEGHVDALDSLLATMRAAANMPDDTTLVSSTTSSSSSDEFYEETEPSDQGAYPPAQNDSVDEADGESRWGSSSTLIDDSTTDSRWTPTSSDDGIVARAIVEATRNHHEELLELLEREPALALDRRVMPSDSDYDADVESIDSSVAEGSDAGYDADEESIDLSEDEVADSEYDADEESVGSSDEGLGIFDFDDE